MSIHTDLNPSLAVLIDADNANASIIEGLLAEVATLGVASVKRIYGDWTTPNLGPWKQVLLEHSIQPIQQFRYVTGKKVCGFGEMKTPRPFVSACDRFIYTEVFAKKLGGQQELALVPKSAKELRCDSALVNLIRSAINACSDESGWTHLGPVGTYVIKTASDFDARNYGFSKLSDLVQAIGLFDMERRETRIYVRNKVKKTAIGAA